jgi:hypothetical protein
MAIVGPVELAGRASLNAYPRRWVERSLPASTDPDDLAAWAKANIVEDEARCVCRTARTARTPAQAILELKRTSPT